MRAVLGSCLSLLLSLVAQAPGPALAASDAEALTLEDAVALAALRTRGVIVARTELLLVDVEKLRALAPLLPRVDLALGASEQFSGAPIIETRGLGGAPGVGPFVDFQVGNSSQPQFTLSLRGRQLIWDGGRSFIVLAQTEDLEAQRRASLQAIESDARLEAARRFYELEKAQRGVRTFAQQIEVDEEQLQRVRALLQAGLGKQNDVASVERNLAEDRITLARRAHAERTAMRAFNLALGRAADTPVRLIVPPDLVEGGAVQVHLPSREELRARARSNRPELAAAEASIELARKNVDVAGAEHWPTIALDAVYSRQSRKPGRIFDDPTENYFASIGVGVDWNLFQGRATTAEVQRAELEVRRAEAELEDLERTVDAEVDDRLESVALFVEVHGLALQAIRSADEAVRLARGLYEQGRGTLLELRDAELRATLTKLTAIEARLDLEIAREALRHSVGGDLESEGERP